MIRHLFLVFLSLSAICHISSASNDSDEHNGHIEKRQARSTCQEVKDLIKDAAKGPNPYHWEPNCNVRRLTRIGAGGAHPPKQTRYGPLQPPANRVPAMRPNENARPSATAELPPDYDARQVYGQKCPSFNFVWDQGACNNCWAVAATSVINHRTCMYSAEFGSNQTTYSLQQAASCNNPDACVPGYAGKALDYWRRNGLVPYECAPLPNVNVMGELSNSACPVQCQDGKSFSDVTMTKGSQVYQMGRANEDEIMREIYLYGPIVANMWIYPDMGLYTGKGVYRPVDGVQGPRFYHSVVLHGWGVENGAKYWIVANSWGTGFGKDGYFQVEKGIDACGIESDSFAAVPEAGLEN